MIYFFRINIFVCSTIVTLLSFASLDVYISSCSVGGNYCIYAECNRTPGYDNSGEPIRSIPTRKCNCGAAGVSRYVKGPYNASATSEPSCADGIRTVPFASAVDLCSALPAPPGNHSVYCGDGSIEVNNIDPVFAGLVCSCSYSTQVKRVVGPTGFALVAYDHEYECSSGHLVSESFYTPYFILTICDAHGGIATGVIREGVDIIATM